MLLLKSKLKKELEKCPQLMQELLLLKKPISRVKHVIKVNRPVFLWGPLVLARVNYAPYC